MTNPTTNLAPGLIPYNQNGNGLNIGSLDNFGVDIDEQRKNPGNSPQTDPDYDPNEVAKQEEELKKRMEELENKVRVCRELRDGAQKNLDATLELKEDWWYYFWNRDGTDATEAADRKVLKAKEANLKKAQEEYEKCKAEIEKLNRLKETNKKEYARKLQEMNGQITSSQEAIRNESLKNSQGLGSVYTNANKVIEKDIQNLDRTEARLRIGRDVLIGIAAGAVACAAAPVIALTIPLMTSLASSVVGAGLLAAATGVVSGVVVGGILAIGAGTAVGVGYGILMSAEEGSLNGKGAINTICNNLWNDCKTAAIDASIAVLTLGFGKVFSGIKAGTRIVMSKIGSALKSTGNLISKPFIALKNHVLKPCARFIGEHVLKPCGNAIRNYVIEPFKKHIGTRFRRYFLNPCKNAKATISNFTKKWIVEPCKRCKTAISNFTKKWIVKPYQKCKTAVCNFTKKWIVEPYQKCKTAISNFTKKWIVEPYQKCKAAICNFTKKWIIEPYRKCKTFLKDYVVEPCKKIISLPYNLLVKKPAQLLETIGKNSLHWLAKNTRIGRFIVKRIRHGNLVLYRVANEHAGKYALKLGGSAGAAGTRFTASKGTNASKAAEQPKGSRTKPQTPEEKKLAKEAADKRAGQEAKKAEQTLREVTNCDGEIQGLSLKTNNGTSIPLNNNSELAQSIRRVPKNPSIQNAPDIYELHPDVVKNIEGGIKSFENGTAKLKITLRNSAGNIEEKEILVRLKGFTYKGKRLPLNQNEYTQLCEGLAKKPPEIPTNLVKKFNFKVKNTSKGSYVEGLDIVEVKNVQGIPRIEVHGGYKKVNPTKVFVNSDGKPINADSKEIAKALHDALQNKSIPEDIIEKIPELSNNIKILPSGRKFVNLGRNSLENVGGKMRFVPDGGEWIEVTKSSTKVAAVPSISTPTATTTADAAASAVAVASASASASARAFRTGEKPVQNTEHSENIQFVNKDDNTAVDNNEKNHDKSHQTPNLDASQTDNLGNLQSEQETQHQKSQYNSEIKLNKSEIVNQLNLSQLDLGLIVAACYVLQQNISKRDTSQLSINSLDFSQKNIKEIDKFLRKFLLKNKTIFRSFIETEKNIQKLPINKLSHDEAKIKQSKENLNRIIGWCYSQMVQQNYSTKQKFAYSPELIKKKEEESLEEQESYNKVNTSKDRNSIEKERQMSRLYLLTNEKNIERLHEISSSLNYNSSLQINYLSQDTLKRLEQLANLIRTPNQISSNNKKMEESLKTSKKTFARRKNSFAQKAQLNLSDENELLQELIDQDFTPFEPYKQTLSPLDINDKNVETAESQQIENLIQKKFAREILNINGLEDDNNISFSSLKNYQFSSVSPSYYQEDNFNKIASNLESENNYSFSLERINGKVLIRKSPINGINHQSYETGGNKNSFNNGGGNQIESQNINSVSKALLPSSNIRKIEDSFARAEINIQTKKQKRFLIFDEKIALKTGRELASLLKRMQREDLEFFLLIMKQYKINATIWENERLLKELIAKRQIFRLKQLCKITSYKKLLKLRVYNTKIMLTFLLTNLMICEPENYEEKEKEIAEFLSSLDPVIIKAINPTKVFSNVLSSLKKSKFFETLKAQRLDKCKKLLKDNLLSIREK